MSARIGRRDVMKLIAAIAVVRNSGALAQQAERTPRIGVLMPYDEQDREGQSNLSAFREGLDRKGLHDGRNVRLDVRWAALDSDTIRREARELVAARPDMILAEGTPATAALLKESRTVPIVFTNVGDPIGSGFVASFARPGGNVTGFIPMEGSVAGKWLELLREIAPRVNRVAFLFNSAMAPNYRHFFDPLQVAARSTGVTAIAAPVSDLSELESTLAALARESSTGFVFMPDGFNIAHASDITALSARYRVPAIYPFRLFAESGGLLSYGIDRGENLRRAADYADRILKGERPVNLPVQAPARYELVVNERAAKALGRLIPQSMRTHAELIE